MRRLWREEYKGWMKDSNGNQLTVTDSTGTTQRTYDAENRVLTKTVPSIGTISYQYDILGSDGE